MFILLIIYSFILLNFLFFFLLLFFLLLLFLLLLLFFFSSFLLFLFSSFLLLFFSTSLLSLLSYFPLLFFPSSPPTLTPAKKYPRLSSPPELEEVRDNNDSALDPNVGVNRRVLTDIFGVARRLLSGPLRDAERQSVVEFEAKAPPRPYTLDPAAPLDGEHEYVEYEPGRISTCFDFVGWRVFVGVCLLAFVCLF